MVVLEHDHATEIVSVRVDAADHHAVFLDETETGGGLSGSGDLALPSGLSGEVTESFGAGGRSTHSVGTINVVLAS